MFNRNRKPQLPRKRPGPRGTMLTLIGALLLWQVLGPTNWVVTGGLLVAFTVVWEAFD